MTKETELTIDVRNANRVEQYNTRINQIIKKAKTCFIVAEVLVALAVLVAMFSAMARAQKQEYGAHTYIEFAFLYLLIPLIELIFVHEFNAKSNHTNKDINKKTFYIFYILTMCPLTRSVLTSLIAGVRTCAFMTGYFFGLACIPNLVGYIFIIISYCNAKNKWKIVYADEIQQKKEYIEEHKQYLAEQAIKRRHEKEVATAQASLSKVGNNFFVKYYYKLRDWAEPDILDVIQEDYSEETKLQRIRKAKEIFNKKLEKLALQIIADDTNKTVDEESRQKAKEILKI